MYAKLGSSIDGRDCTRSIRDGCHGSVRKQWNETMLGMSKVALQVEKNVGCVLISALAFYAHHLRVQD